MQINRSILCTNTCNMQPADRTAKDIRYIVVHYVGALGDAKANCQYYASSSVGASAHYYVGFAGDIWQSVSDQNIAWHCGTYGTYYHPDCRNANSIGVEMCVRKKNASTLYASDTDWYFEKETIEAAAGLILELMEQYGIETDHILRHYDVTHKICPAPFVHNPKAWEDFKTLLKTEDRSAKVNYVAAVESPDGILMLRTGPGTSYPSVGSAKTGTVVNVRREYPNGWRYCRYYDGGGKLWEGYMGGAYLKPCPDYPHMIVKSPDGILNMRKYPHPTGEFIIGLRNGYNVGVLQDAQNGWKLLLCGDSFGYADGAYLTEVGGYQSWTGKITGGNLRIRTEPVDGDIRYVLADGTLLEITGEIMGSDGYIWYQVKKDGNAIGCCRSDFVRKI